MNCCRVCRTSDADVLYSLYAKLHDLSSTEMLTAITGLQFSREDNLPRYICKGCSDETIQCYQLRQKCLESDEILRAAQRSDDQIECRVVTIVQNNNDMLCSNEEAEDFTAVDTLYEFIKPGEPFVVDIGNSVGDVPLSEQPNEQSSSSTVQEIYMDDASTCDEEYLEMVEPGKEDESTEVDADEDIQFENIEILDVDETEPPIICCGCSKVFELEEQLNQHCTEEHLPNRIKVSSKPFECDICYSRFLNPQRLQQHQNRFYVHRKYCCNTCNARFIRRGSLINHKKSIHLGKRTYRCDVCTKGFCTSSTLLSHRLLHTQDKKFQCDLCYKTFLRKSDMHVHLLSHSDERPWGCTNCKMKFKSKAHLKHHQKVHTGARPYNCSKCEQCFTTYAERKVHELAHEDIHPFKCEFCNKIYKRNYKMQVHIRKMHTGERPYACKKCSQKFYQNWELTAHQKEEHPELSNAQPKLDCSMYVEADDN